MAAALGPHFVGGSLGWHDFLASTARLFKNEPGYRIPVKADPDIVIRHINRISSRHRSRHIGLATCGNRSRSLRIQMQFLFLPLTTS